MGVASNRVDVKQAAAVAERATRAARRALCRALPAHRTTGRPACSSWRGSSVVRNSAHDSICACSVDEVVDAVLHRFAEARQIAEGVAARALTALARSMAEPGPVVVNPSARPRAGMVELVVAADESPNADVQVRLGAFGLPGSLTLDADTVRTILGMLQGPQIDNDTWIQDVRVEEDETGIDITIAFGPEEHPTSPSPSQAGPLHPARGPARRHGAHPDRPAPHPAHRGPGRPGGPASVGGRFDPAPPWPTRRRSKRRRTGRRRGGAGHPAANGLVTVAVDPADGTFAIDGLAGFGRLVDGGDLGDSYNYSPPGGDSLGRPSRVGRGHCGGAGSGAGHRRGHRHLPLARPRRRRPAGPAVGEHTVMVTTDDRGAGRRAHRAGDHPVREPGAGPPPAGPPAPARAGPVLRGRVRLRHRATGA